MRVLLLSNMYPSAADPAYGSFIARQQGRLTSEHGVSFQLVVTSKRGGGLAGFGKYMSLVLRTLGATLAGGYDLVHAHYLMPMAALSLLPAALRRRPLVVTAHGTDIRTGQRPLVRMGIRWALQRACRVIAVSDFLARQLELGYGYPARDVLVCDMGVDTERFAPPDGHGKAALKAAQGMTEAVPHIVYVGSFTEHKGVEDLAEALAIMADDGVVYRATLVGDGPLRAPVQGRLRPLGDRVRLMPSVAHSQLPALLGSADVLALPSRREGVGLLVCLEALACGAPVVAARAGGLVELVVDGVNGALVEPGDPMGLARALSKVCADPETLARLAAGARRSALAHDERRQAARVAKVYEECVAAG